MSYLRHSAVWRKGIQDGSSVTDLTSPVSSRCSVNPVHTRSLSQVEKTPSYLRNSAVWQKGIQDGSSVPDLASSVSGQCSVNPVRTRSLFQEKRTPSYLHNSAVWQKGIQDGSSVPDLASSVSGQCSVNPVRTRSLFQEKRTPSYLRKSAVWRKGIQDGSSVPDLASSVSGQCSVNPVRTRSLSQVEKRSRITEDLKADWCDLFSKWSSKLPSLSEEETEKFQRAVKAGNLSEAMSVVNMSEVMLRNTKLNIAITGNSGSGKSSFINAIRSLNDDDRGAAETGVTETTKDPTAYPHPIHPNVIVWDLPGIGTTKYPAETYLTDVKVCRYDFFIIIAAVRFTEADTKLAKEINSMGKKFYFVRTKVDADLVNERRKRDFNEEKTLEAIRSDCMEQLQEAGISSPQVFLVSRWDFDKYDYPQLQETLANDLNIHKRHILICALPSTSEEILKEKQKALQEQIWKQALKSCALAAVPLPFLSVKCDVDILVENMREYCKSFGLDNDSIKSLAKQVRMSVTELKSVIKSPLAKDITKEEALKRLREATGEPIMTVKYFISMIPLIGTGIAAKKSYSITYEVLHTFLDEVTEDAQRVLKKALEGAENNL
ncbi:interferon-inducible GTPase 5-like [Mauremys reevesii]|uniref:interferon-inducible GTPase 5-like n=1 Tax=Mauremys reevesii TaxID=260615 RepID=UPI00193FAC8F|nr:interferon-inducible GTPase 5-like [Mauremys reevesii]